MKCKIWEVGIRYLIHAQNLDTCNEVYLKRIKKFPLLSFVYFLNFAFPSFFLSFFFSRKKILHTLLRIFGIEGYRNCIYCFQILSTFSGILYNTCNCEYLQIFLQFFSHLAVKEYKIFSTFRITYLEEVCSSSSYFRYLL